MGSFEMALKILQLAAAASQAAANARQVYLALREAAQRDKSLTPQESAQLDAEAEAIFASPASQPSGR